MFAGYTTNNNFLLCIFNDNMSSLVPIQGQWNAFEINCKKFEC